MAVGPQTSPATSSTSWAGCWPPASPGQLSGGRKSVKWSLYPSKFDLLAGREKLLFQTGILSEGYSHHKRSVTLGSILFSAQPLLHRDSTDSTAGSQQPPWPQAVSAATPVTSYRLTLGMSSTDSWFVATDSQFVNTWLICGRNHGKTFVYPFPIILTLKKNRKISIFVKFFVA